MNRKIVKDQILVRDDDVFRLKGTCISYQQSVEEFKKVHQIIVDEGAIHVAAIVCGTLDWFPGGVEFIKDAYDKKELIPEVHGWDHIDYGDIPKREIINHLLRSIEVIRRNFGYNPTKFYTPYGAFSSSIKEAAELVGLEVIDCSNIVFPKRKFFGGKNWQNYCEAVLSGKVDLFLHYHEDKWFKPSETHSLIKTLKTIKNNDPSFWRE